MHRRSVVAMALIASLALGGSLLIGGVAGAKEAPKKKVFTVKIAKTPLGKILVDSKGRTLYAFGPDGTDTVAPHCVDACADAWPALTSKKKPTVGKGLKLKLVGIGGGGQVAYNSHLLYRFSGDSAAGDTNGQGIGNVWYVVGANGEPITTTS